MAVALDLARKGQGRVEPNPMVGAVVVKNGETVATGYHAVFGGLHAEVAALEEAGASAGGATLYVTLEPCCHHGKTPPCTDAIMRAGLHRVVAAMLDPFEKVAGNGVDTLRHAGIEVDVGCRQEQAQKLNAPYVKLRTRGMPYVLLKWAMTFDGKIATKTGDSRWISSAASRRIVHTMRGRVDAIVTGIGTVLMDDPELTARPPGPRKATRIVLDSSARTPTDSRLVKTLSRAGLIVAATEAAPANRVRALTAAGVEVSRLPARNDGRVDCLAFVRSLAAREMTNVLVEGGTALAASFIEAGLVDEIHCFLAPKIAGGIEAPNPIGGTGIARMADALALEVVSCRQVGGDVYVRAEVKP